ncbi:MAG TPA: RidA family protein [Gaiellaceae bacterium]|nr:RidA family protein [Gaiellaceae bacterium]
MERRNVNPWTWQDQFGFSQAVDVSGGERVLYCAGQTSSAADGSTLHAGDMRAQAEQAFDNLETVLQAAEMSLADVVRLNSYVTDVDLFFAEGAEVVAKRSAAAGIQPAATLLGVTRLAFPDILIELEATAVA